jgi:signal transduction histidine kinase
MRGTVGPGGRDQKAQPAPAARRHPLAGPAALERRRAHGPQRDPSAAVSEAVEHERRRLAAELHDTVMQDLALALANARALHADPAAPAQAGEVLAAAERAMAGARAMLDRVRSEPASLVITVAETVRAAAGRVPLTFTAAAVPAAAEPDGRTFDTIVHIGREAVTNAVKHGSPRAVEVVLEHGDEWRLSIRDDGCGFDYAEATGGFGLASMMRQAQALGGSLRVLSAGGAGTTVEAVLP